MPLATNKPLSLEEKKLLTLIAGEMKARGLKLPDIPQEALAQKSLDWPLDDKGYFMSRKGRHYNPKPQQAAFVKSTAKFCMFYGGRGCIDGHTLVGGVPIAERNYPDAVDTLFGESLATPGYLKGKADLYSVKTLLGSSVVVTLQHRFLTPKGWLPLNQLESGSLLLSDGTYRERSEKKTMPNYLDRYSLGFHLNGELQNLLEQACQDILLQLHNFVYGSSALVLPFHPSIEGSLNLLLYRLYVQYLISSTFSEELLHQFQEMIQSHLYLLRSGIVELDQTHQPTSFSDGSCEIHVDQLLLGHISSQSILQNPGKCLEELLHLLQLDFSVFLQLLSRECIFLGDLLLSSRPPEDIYNYNAKFDEIQSIDYVDYGEFYDLQVDDFQHYSTEGLYHHNSGKSVSGSQKAMIKIMQGENGAVINPDFENFVLSTWPEFKEWIPWEMVVPSQRNRQNDAWQPSKPFVMVFLNGARVYCKGLKDPDSARGPNLNWVWYDESGRDETGMAFKLIIPSLRVGRNPQAWCTQTAKPPSHWSYKFFIEKDIPQDAVDAFGLSGQSVDDFIQSFHMSTDENHENLDPMFYASLLATYHSGGLRERELGGNFVEDGGKIGDSSKIQKIEDVPTFWKWGRQVRYWDMAGTEKKRKNGHFNDPDEAVGTRVMVTDEKDPKFVILDQVGGYFAWDKLVQVIAETALKDGPEVTVVIEQEPGSGGKNQVAAIESYFKENDRYPQLKYFRVAKQLPTDRVQEAYVWFGYANAGNVYMIDNPFWNKVFLEQVDGFTFMLHDDRVTSCSGAMRWLSPIFRKWKRTEFVAI